MLISISIVPNRLLEYFEIRNVSVNEDVDKSVKFVFEFRGCIMILLKKQASFTVTRGIPLILKSPMVIEIVHKRQRYQPVFF